MAVTTHEIVQASPQGEEKVRIACRVNVANDAVGCDDLEGLRRIGCETVQVGEP
jgi:hypothetical protein